MKPQCLDPQNFDLPLEIMHEILVRVPVKPLCRSKCVSKPWRSLISDPVFVAKYFKAVENKDVFFQRRRLLFTMADGQLHWLYCLYSLDLDQLLNENDHNVGIGGLVATPTELDFVYSHLPEGGRNWRPFVHYSCYGLFLSKIISGGGSYSLINPVTKESKTLPRPPIWRLPKKPPFYGVSLYGLGFDPSTNVFKVVNGQDYDDGIVFSVYTLQTNSWRKIDYIFPYVPLCHDGIVVNGAVHWLVRKVADRSLVIISFLLAEEEVREIPLPPIPSNRLGDLGVFRNWLCITLAPALAGVKCNEFWVMKEHGVRESWTMMKVSKPYRTLSHSGFWTESHDLMVFDQSSLVMYNFTDGTFWNLSLDISDSAGEDCHFGEDPSEDCHFGSVGIYVESLPSFIDQEQHRSKEDESAQRGGSCVYKSSA